MAALVGFPSLNFRNAGYFVGFRVLTRLQLYLPYLPGSKDTGFGPPKHRESWFGYFAFSVT